MSKPFLVLLISLLFVAGHKENLPDSKLAKKVRIAVWPRLTKELTDKRLKFNYPIYIRIFKKEHILEIWVKSGQQYQLFKGYEVCYFSGGLGTKTRVNDNKSPEGFYAVKPNQLQPASAYYLAINIGYPNKLEVRNGYTGDAIMVHGHCASIGCYAMTNPFIEEIYTLIYKAFESGQQKIDFDIFPFRMEQQNMNAYATSPNILFWKTMKPGYDLFEKTHLPPAVNMNGPKYAFKY